MTESKVDATCTNSDNDRKLRVQVLASLDRAERIRSRITRRNRRILLLFVGAFLVDGQAFFLIDRFIVGSVDERIFYFGICATIISLVGAILGYRESSRVEHDREEIVILTTQVRENYQTLDRQTGLTEFEQANIRIRLSKLDFAR